MSDDEYYSEEEVDAEEESKPTSQLKPSASKPVTAEDPAGSDDSASEQGENDSDDDSDDSLLDMDEDDDKLFGEDDDEPDGSRKRSPTKVRPIVSPAAEQSYDMFAKGVFGEDDDAGDYASEEDDEEADLEGEAYLQKFDDSIRKTVVADHHPALLQHSNEEVEAMCNIVRLKDGTIADPLHTTLPFLTKYEKARILGERARQLGAGATPFVKVDDTIIDEYLIALKELNERKLPFIIKRPLPNGGSEYWRVNDLEIL